MKATTRGATRRTKRRAAAKRPTDVAAPAAAGLTAARIAADPGAYHVHVGADSGVDRSRSGGNLADITKPHVRLFDVPGYVRRVRVSITRYIGGAHYFASVEEEDNLIFDAREQAWAKAWDDRAGRGRSWSEKFNRPEHAEDFVQLVLRDSFEPGTYRIDREFLGTATYGREGD